MPKDNKDVPGNAVASALAVQREMVRLAEQVYRMERVLDRLDGDNVFIKGLRFRPPFGEGDQWLGVVTADIEGVPKVGFVSDETFASTVRKAVAMLENGSMKWRDDEYKSS